MYDSLKEQVLLANKMLVEHHLVILTWGNVSQIDREHNIIAIKPSGVSYQTMCSEDIVVVDLDGHILEGELYPSSDIQTHIQLYKHFQIGGIVHTHSRFATIFAQANRSIPVYGTTHADYFYGSIPCTRHMSINEIQGSYELECANVIIETMQKNNIDFHCMSAVLMANHGPFCWGETALEAVQHAMILEEVACMAYHTEQFDHSLNMQESLIKKHYERKHGNDAYYGQSLKKRS